MRVKVLTVRKLPSSYRLKSQWTEMTRGTRVTSLDGIDYVASCDSKTSGPHHKRLDNSRLDGHVRRLRRKRGGRKRTQKWGPNCDWSLKDLEVLIGTQHIYKFNQVDSFGKIHALRFLIKKKSIFLLCRHIHDADRNLKNNCAIFLICIYKQDARSSIPKLSNNKCNIPLDSHFIEPCLSIMWLRDLRGQLPP